MIPRKTLVHPSTHVRDARLYVVVVEGAKTEPKYFNALQEHDLIPKHKVHIEVVSPIDHKSAPKYLIACAEEKFNSIKSRLPDDECWIVFDVDKHSGSDRIEQIYSALHDAENQKWFVALSNPCFEVWHLLHITDDLTGIDDGAATAEKRLRDLLGGYSKNNVPRPCLNAEALRNAIVRGKARDTDPKSPIPQLPGTRVYRLVEKLVSARIA
ncbi:MAG TPA: RloB family protein [Polyangium sp.]|nr:RloB family protein [Polyangium sp.]